MNESEIKSGCQFAIKGNQNLFRYSDECIEYANGDMRGQWVAHVESFNLFGMIVKCVDNTKFLLFSDMTSCV